MPDNHTNYHVSNKVISKFRTPITFQPQIYVILKFPAISNNFDIPKRTKRRTQGSKDWVQRVTRLKFILIMLYITTQIIDLFIRVFPLPINQIQLSRFISVLFAPFIIYTKKYTVKNNVQFAVLNLCLETINLFRELNIIFCQSSLLAVFDH